MAAESSLYFIICFVCFTSTLVRHLAYPIPLSSTYMCHLPLLFYLLFFPISSSIFSSPAPPNQASAVSIWNFIVSSPVQNEPSKYNGHSVGRLSITPIFKKTCRLVLATKSENLHVFGVLRILHLVV